MGKRKTGKLTRLLSFIVAMAMGVSVLPVSALADGWKTNAPTYTPGTEGEYYYVGATQDPSDKGASAAVDNVYINDNVDATPIHKYLLDLSSQKGENTSFWTYCSDFFIAPVKDKTYKRMPIEEVVPDTNFFNIDKEEQAQKLRAILLNSDLFLSEEALLQQMTDAGAVNPKVGEAIAATQIAIWQTVNGAAAKTVQASSAMSNQNVKKYLAFLMAVEPVNDVMAEIHIENIAKTIESNNTYTSVIKYNVVGSGVSGAIPTLQNISVEMTLNGVKYSVNQQNEGNGSQYINIDATNKTITLSNLPLGQKIQLTVSGKQDGVKVVNLFYPDEGRTHSQTLVSVMEEAVTMSSTVELDPPGNTASVTINKRWQAAGQNNTALSPTLPDGYVKGEISAFRFYYYIPAEPANNLNKTQIGRELEIDGNGYAVSGDLFEKSVGGNKKYYKVVEYIGGSATDKTAYFYIDNSGKTQWVDNNLTPILAFGGYFFNEKAAQTGSVIISKTVDNQAAIVEADGGAKFTAPNQAFNLNITYSVEGSEIRLPYAGQYVKNGETLNTAGAVTLKHGESIELFNVPAGWTIYVSEDLSGLSAAWVGVTTEGSALSEVNSPKTIALVNHYNLGSIIIDKTFGDNSLITSFANAGEISFKITGIDSFEKTVDVTATSGSSFTLNATGIPYGNAVITEIVKLGGNTYSVTSNFTDFKTNVTIGESNGSIGFVNTYDRARASLIVGKTVKKTGTIADESTIPAEFTFTLFNSDGTTRAIDVNGDEIADITLKNGQYARIDNLIPQAYVLVESGVADFAADAKFNYSLAVTAQAALPAGESGTVISPDLTNRADGAGFNLAEGKVAYIDFKNTFTGLAGKLTVTKTYSGATPDVVFTVYKDSVNDPNPVSVTLTNSKKSHTFDLAPGTYIVVESDAEKTGYTLVTTWKVNNKGVTADDGGVAVDVTNNATTTVAVNNKYTLDTGTVRFGKEFTNPTLRTGTATFTVTGADGKSYKIYNSGGAAVSSGTIKNDKTEIKLANGQYAIIEGIPTETTVTVTEVASDYYTVSGQSAKSGTVAEKGQQLDLGDFQNTWNTMDLAVEKQIGGVLTWESSELAGKKYIFTITGPEGWDGTYAPSKGGARISLTPVTGETGKFTFVLNKGTKAVTLYDLPAGKYVVVEDTAAAKIVGYVHTVSYSHANGAIDGSGAKTFIVTNIYNPSVGTGHITKLVDEYADPNNIYQITLKVEKGAYQGAETDFSKLVSFTRTVLGNTTPFVDGEAVWNAQTSTFTFEIKANEVVNFTAPDGLVFTVTETAVKGGFSSDRMVAVGGYFDPSYNFGLHHDPESAKPQPTPFSFGVDSKDVYQAIYNKTVREGRLTVEKAVEGSEADKATGFTFTLYIKTGEKANGEAIYTKFGDSFTLKHGETKVFTDLPLNAEYKVVETPNAIFDVEYANQTDIIGRDNVTVTVTNTRKTADLIIEKEIGGLTWGSPQLANKSFNFTISGPEGWDGKYAETPGGDRISLTPVTGETGKFTFTLNKANPNLILYGIPAGWYTIAEDAEAAKIDGYTLTATHVVEGDGTINGAKAMIGENKITFKNSYSLITGGLTITKKEVFNRTPTWESRPTTQAHTMELQRSADGGTTWKAFAVSGKTDAYGVFTLKGDASVTFTGLPITGFIYRVAETSAVAYDGYTSPVVKYSSERVTLETGKTKTITVTNTYERSGLNYSLTVEKQANYKLASGVEADLPAGIAIKDFSFTVKRGEVVVYTGSVKPGEPVTISNLPAGDYTVVEGDGTVAGYTTLDGTTTVNIALSDKTLTATATLINNYEQQKGNLVVSKTVVNQNGAVVPQSFTFIITGPNGWGGKYFATDDLSGTPATLNQNENDDFTLTLEDSQSVTLYGIPGGTYTVTEAYTYDQAANGGFYSHAVTGGGAVTVEQDKTATAAFTNTYTLNLGTFSLTKHLSGVENVNGESPIPNGKSFTFELSGGSAGWYGKVADKLTGRGEYNAETGIFTFTITANQTSDGNISITLPYGIYNIAEVQENIDIGGHTYEGHTLLKALGGDRFEAMESGAFEINENASTFAALCRNNYDKDGAAVIITKDVAGFAGDDDFTFTLRYKDEAPFDTKNVIIFDNKGNTRSVTTTGGQVTIKANEYALFTGLDLNKDVVVTETLGQTYELDSATLQNFSFKTITVENGVISFDGGTLPVLSDVVASATEPALEGNTGGKTEAGFPGLAFSFTNIRRLGAITVEKTVAGPLFANESYEIALSLIDGKTPVDAANLTGISVSIGGQPLAFTLEEGNIVFVIKANEIATISGLPAGLDFEIAEKPFGVSSADHGRFNVNVYDVTYTGHKSKVPVGDTATCTIENTRRLGSIDIDKAIPFTNNPDNQDTFEINVIFDIAGFGWDIDSVDGFFTKESAEGENYTITIEGDTLTLSALIKNYEMLKIGNIPAGLTYVVREILTPEQEARYTSRISPYDGFIDLKGAGDSTKNDSSKDNITVKNFDVPGNSLVITKDVVGTAGSPVLTDRYAFTLGLFVENVAGMESYFAAKAITDLEKAKENLVTLETALKNAHAAFDPIAFNAAKEALAIYVDESGNITEAGKIALGDTLLINCETCLGEGAITPEPADCTNCIETCDICNNEGSVISAADCAECAALEDKSGCAACDGTGVIETSEPCTHGGKILRGDCTCTDGLVTPADIECPDCLGAKQVEDTAAIAAFVDGKLAEYRANEAVAAKATLDSAQEAFDGCIALIGRIEDVLAKLLIDEPVAFDLDYNIVDENGGIKIPLDPATVLTKLTAKGPDGQNITPQISLGQDEQGNFNGLYTFYLGHGEMLMLENLPLGTVCTVSEHVPQTPPETLISVTINGEEGNEATGVIGRGDEPANIHAFVNTFDTATGQIVVKKVWATEVGADSIEVELYKDGEFYDKVTLSAENGWSHTFEDLELGHSYSVKEIEIEGYGVLYSAKEIILTYANKDSESITVTNSKKSIITTEPEDPGDTTTPGDTTQPDDTTTPGETTEPEEEIETTTPLDPYEPEDTTMPPKPPFIDEEEELDPEDPLVDLPNTGGVAPSMLMSLLGGGMLGLGALLGKKKKGD